MDRRGLKKIAQETVEWLECGCNEFPRLREEAQLAARASRVFTGDELDAMKQKTGRRPPRAEMTAIQVTAESTLEAARRLPGAVCLVFGSARRPGGGFLNGASAQEESVARGSGLYAVETKHTGLYIQKDRVRAPFYTHDMIYAPDVPVFRDRDDLPLDAMFRTGLIVACAPNKSSARGKQREACDRVLVERAGYVLALAAEKRHTTVVLGAWGCGVFGNDPHVLAEAFASMLTNEGPFAHTFRCVVFAMMDETSPAFRVFRQKFADNGIKAGDAISAKSSLPI